MVIARRWDAQVARSIPGVGDLIFHLSFQISMNSMSKALSPIGPPRSLDPVLPALSQLIMIVKMYYTE